MTRDSGSYPCTLDCGRPAGDAFLCRECSGQLATMLEITPWLLRQLRVNECRAARYTDAVRSSDTSHALPYDPGAADVRDAVINTLSTWSREIEDRTGQTCPAKTPAGAADWLGTQQHTIRLHPAAAEIHADLAQVTACAYRVIDRPQGRVFVGPCGADTPDGPCGQDLYARADPGGRARLDPRQATVRCSCGAEWDAEKRRDWLLSELRDTLATAGEIASAVGMLAGRTVSVKTIRTWANRGQIPSHYPPGGGPARHPIGEVVDYAAARARSA